MRSFNTLQGEGFKRLMKEVAPLYKIPSASYIKKKLLEKYEVTAHMYKQKLHIVEHICVTTDIWTETMAEKSYIGVTFHFFEKTTPRNFSVVKELKSNHTAEYISNTLTNIFNEWGVPISKIRCIVTDNGANMVAGAKAVVGERNHLPCFAHTINLVVQTVLENKFVKEIVIKVREIVKWIKNSVINSDKLRKIQIDTGIPEGSVQKMILDVETRWNSLYYMLQRFVDMLRIVTVIVIEGKNAPALPSGNEIEAVKEIILLLKPFESITKELSGENYITISKVIPMISCLMSQLNSFSPKIQSVSELRGSLIKEVDKRFGQIEFNNHVALATLIDPRFKSMHFRNPIACGRAITKLKEIIVNELTSASTSESEEETAKDYDFWIHHKQLLTGQKRKKRNERFIYEVQYLL